MFFFNQNDKLAFCFPQMLLCSANILLRLLIIPLLLSGDGSIVTNSNVPLQNYPCRHLTTLPPWLSTNSELSAVWTLCTEMGDSGNGILFTNKANSTLGCIQSQRDS